MRIVVAYPPGGGIDIMARQLAERLAPQWGQPVVVENRPGGSTIPATELVAKSAPDGHTILLTTDSTFSINPHLFAKLPYSDKDFVGGHAAHPAAAAAARAPLGRRRITSRSW